MAGAGWRSRRIGRGRQGRDTWQARDEWATRGLRVTDGQHVDLGAVLGALGVFSLKSSPLSWKLVFLLLVPFKIRGLILHHFLGYK